MQMARRLLSCSDGSSHFFLHILCKDPIPALGPLSSKTIPAIELAIFFFYFVSKAYYVICHRINEKMPLFKSVSIEISMEIV